MRVVIALLVLLNVVTIGSFVFHRYTESRAEEEDIYIEPNQPPLNGRYFRHELGFDNQQMELFRKAHRQFHQQANEVILEIGRTKETLYGELQKTDPDTLLIRQHARQIGDAHARLKEETARFYLTLKAICREDQQGKLDQIFTPLFNEPQHTGNGRGHRNGRGMHGN